MTPSLTGNTCTRVYKEGFKGGTFQYKVGFKGGA
jgi:hypothetical protein